MSNVTFKTYVCGVGFGADEIDVIVDVHSFYQGERATWHEPAVDAYVSYNVYLEEGGECIYNTLTEEQQYYLDEKVYEYMEQYFNDYCDGDY